MSRFGWSTNPSDEEHKMPSRKRRSKRRSDYLESGSDPVYIRVGNPSIRDRFYEEVVAYSRRDVTAFERVVERTLNENQGFPLLIVVNAWQPWVDEILASCITEDIRDACCDELSQRNREVQNTDFSRFPERRIVGKKDTVTWSFVVDHINIPQAYWWTAGLQPPHHPDGYTIDSYRFRLGVWTCAEGAKIDRGLDPRDTRYRLTEKVTVTLIFTDSNTLPKQLSNRIHLLLFEDIYHGNDASFEKLYERDDGVNWIFLKLWNFLTDWENVLKQFEDRLEIAERNSGQRKGPADIRTHESHVQIRSIYILQQYLRFHTRSVGRLGAFQDMRMEDDGNEFERRTPDIFRNKKVGNLLQSTKAGNMNLDDAYADMSQYQEEFELLIERYKNLTEHEFNMDNARQAEDTSFLIVIATIFLPLSFLASVWGMTKFTAPPITFVYVAIPVLVLSVILAPTIPRLRRKLREQRNENLRPYVYLNRISVDEKKVRLLGEEIPGSREGVGLNEDDKLKKRESQPLR